MTLCSSDVSFEWPLLRRPMYFIVDDPAPCLNLAHYEQYWEPHVRDVPNSFTAAWADVVEEFGIRGKFSVLPVPAAIGRIDRPLPDMRPADQDEFIRIIRERVSPQMDIGIEFLTHFLAWDIHHDRPLDYTEKTMGPFTSRGHLTEYFAYGLRILHNLGLQPTGATSPGAACRDIEWEYQSAIRDAVKLVTGRPVAWYFLHVDDISPVVLPKIMSLNAERGEACVHIPSAGMDPSWQTQRGEPSQPDLLIMEDGSSGRLVDLYRNGSVLSFHTHWQSLFSEGRATGLADLRILMARIREHLGEHIRWTKCSDLADVMVARSTARASVREEAGRVDVDITSPSGCPNFTVRIRSCGAARSVRVAGMELRRLPDDSAYLESGSWKQEVNGLAWCADLPPGHLAVSITPHGGG